MVGTTTQPATHPSAITVDFEAWLAEEGPPSASKDMKLAPTKTLGAKLSEEAPHHKASPPGSPPRELEHEEAAASNEMESFIDDALVDELVRDVLKDGGEAVTHGLTQVSTRDGRDRLSGNKRSAASNVDRSIRQCISAREKQAAHLAGAPSDAQSSEAPTYYCAFPGCDRKYACKDAVRKHCRKHHPEWLKGLGKGSVARIA